MGIIAVGLAAPAVPYAPTLVSPVNGVYMDMSGAVTFKWQFNPQVSSNTMKGWQFFRTVNSGTSSWWNAATLSWQTTAVWNSYTLAATVSGSANNWTYAFPVGAWANGNQYQWSVTTQDNVGYGPPASFFSINAQTAPTVSVNSPSGSVVTATPIVGWTGTFAPGTSQLTYRVIIYTTAQYGATGFSPGVSAGFYDTGVVGGNATSVNLANIPVYLAVGSYRAYVQVTETGGQASPWAYSAFTEAYVGPNAPTLTVTPNTDPTTGYPILQITLVTNENLLSANDANPSQGSGTWQAVSGCIVTNNVNGLQMTPA